MNFKTSQEIKILAEGGAILARILNQLIVAAKPGVTTRALEELARKLIIQADAQPAFLGYHGYPAALCTSINEEIVHGVPSDRVLKNGDVLKLDLGIIYKKLFTDHAKTTIVGNDTSAKKNKIISVTEEALVRGIDASKVGNTTGDIGNAIATYVREHGFDVVRELVGHGVGHSVHEGPEVPNYGKPGEGEVLKPGMIIAIEPMVVEGAWKIADGPDGFAFITKDKKIAAHAEHTVAITENGPIILTQ
jgi:methionyl aminopeptidase